MSFPPPTTGQARVIWLALSGLAVATMAGLVIALVVGLGVVVRILAPVLWPLAIAGVLAYLLDPVVDFFENRGLPRARAIMAVFGLAAVILLALFGSVVPQLVTESRQLISRIPAYVSKAEKQLSQFVAHPPVWAERFLSGNQRAVPAPGDTNAPAGAIEAANTTPGDTNPVTRDNIKAVTSWLTDALPKVGSWMVGQIGRVAGLFGILAGLFLIPVYLFYFLLEKEGISSKWTDYLPVTDSQFKRELVFVLQSINSYLITFFRGQVLVAICDGILYTIGFLMVGLPYAVLLGAAAIFLTMIPFIGAMVICAAALALAVVQFGDWNHPLLVLAVFGVVQTLEGLVISPKIMGDRVGLHPLTIIIAVITGTTLLGGILGGILAIPLTAALRVIMFRYIWKRQKGAVADTPLNAA